MSLSYEAVEKLLGDFFERHTADDKEGMNAVLADIQEKLSSREADSEPFKQYFNDMYAGRGAINVAGMMQDYPRESIMRELLQNVFGCDYDTSDIKVMIEFLDEGQVKLTYNETGFSLAQVFYYLSVGRNEGISEREGRFGLGAKSVFANVDWFKMRSNNYSLRVVNDEGTLKVRELDLTAPTFKHTEIVFSLDETDQRKLHENLTTLTSAKGDYINLVELCFAFIRKKHLRSTDEEECPSRTFNIAVINYGKPEAVYKIQEYRKDENSIPKIRFSENGKSVADFIQAERDGFIYLIPYAVSGAKREAAKVMMSKYNYFSTFELTGLVRANSQKFIQEQLSAFFVSVPNSYITNNRAGIRHDCLEEVSSKIAGGIMSVVEEYKRLFVLELTARKDNPERYMLRPKQYVFEFFYNYINTSTLVSGLKEKFCDGISLLMPGSEEPVSFAELRENGIFTERSEVTKQEHEDGSAAKMLLDDINRLEKWYDGDPDHVMLARYNWGDLASDDEGSEFLYAFCRSESTYLMSSDGNRQINDYDLGLGFKSIIERKLDKCIVNGAVMDENALEEAFRIIDEMFGESYRIAMKYFQFVITAGSTTIQFEISKINIGNFKKAYDVLAAHEMRFENHQIYNQVVTLFMNSFTNGKDVMTFLREIKGQGGEVTLALDINKRYRFAAYGKQFMIPSNITNADLLEIVGDVYALIDSGMFLNRMFDFPYNPARYSFDSEEILAALPEGGTAEKIDALLGRVFVCDLGLDKVALLDKNNKLLKIVDISDKLDNADKETADRFVILREGAPKPVFAEFVEFLLTGENKNVLKALFSSTEEPNLVLLDQIPYYFKPIPTITRREFDFLRGEVKRIADYKAKKDYRNYFARDINAKLFGYGGVCPCCGYETDVINSFVMRNFTVEMLNGEKEQKFNFALYLCSNDANAAGGWIIDDISIGGMSPFLWLEEISLIDKIPAEFLYCRIKYRPQFTYDICEAAAEEQGAFGENVHDGNEEVMDIILTPLLAAKWFDDNSKALASRLKAEHEAESSDENPNEAESAE